MAIGQFRNMNDFDDVAGFEVSEIPKSVKAEVVEATQDIEELHIDDLLRLTVERGASDLHLSVGLPPMIRVDGRLVRTNFRPLRPMPFCPLDSTKTFATSYTINKIDTDPVCLKDGTNHKL